jgi:hypothetical protein
VGCEEETLRQEEDDHPSDEHELSLEEEDDDLEGHKEKELQWAKRNGRREGSHLETVRDPDHGESDDRDGSLSYGNGDDKIEKLREEQVKGESADKERGSWSESGASSLMSKLWLT